MMDFAIHKLDSSDVKAAQQIVALFQEAFELEAQEPRPKYLGRLLSRADFHVIAALREGAVAGALTAHEMEMLDGRREMFIYDVAVAEPQRRQGIGRALIEFARDLCERRGLSAMFVAAHADEPHAVAFYEACGLARQDVAMFTHEFRTEKPQP